MVVDARTMALTYVDLEGLAEFRQRSGIGTPTWAPPLLPADLRLPEYVSTAPREEWCMPPPHVRTEAGEALWCGKQRRGGRILAICGGPKPMLRLCFMQTPSTNAPTRQRRPCDQRDMVGGKLGDDTQPLTTDVSGGRAKL